MGILDNLPHTASAYTRQRTSDGLMGSSDAFVLYFQNRRCWRQNASDRAIAEYAKRGISVTDRVYFTSDPALDETHVLLIDGEIYEVRSHAKPDASSGLGVVWRVMCEITTTGSTLDLID